MKDFTYVGHNGKLNDYFLISEKAYTDPGWIAEVHNDAYAFSRQDLPDDVDLVLVRNSEKEDPDVPESLSESVSIFPEKSDLFSFFELPGDSIFENLQSVLWNWGECSVLVAEDFSHTGRPYLIPSDWDYSHPCYTAVDPYAMQDGLSESERAYLMGHIVGIASRSVSICKRVGFRKSFRNLCREVNGACHNEPVLRADVYNPHLCCRNGVHGIPAIQSCIRRVPDEHGMLGSGIDSSRYLGSYNSMQEMILDNMHHGISSIDEYAQNDAVLASKYAWKLVELKTKEQSKNPVSEQKASELER